MRKSPKCAICAWDAIPGNNGERLMHLQSGGLAGRREDNCYSVTSDSSVTSERGGNTVIIVGSTTFYDHWIQNRRGAMHSSASATMHKTVGPSQP